MQLKDGSLLVSDDYNGAVYRVTYGKPKVPARCAAATRLAVISGSSAKRSLRQCPGPMLCFALEMTRR